MAADPILALSSPQLNKSHNVSADLQGRRFGVLLELWEAALSAMAKDLDILSLPGVRQRARSALRSILKAPFLSSFSSRCLILSTLVLEPCNYQLSEEVKRLRISDSVRRASHQYPR